MKLTHYTVGGANNLMFASVFALLLVFPKASAASQASCLHFGHQLH